MVATNHIDSSKKGKKVLYHYPSDQRMIRWMLKNQNKSSKYYLVINKNPTTTTTNHIDRIKKKFHTTAFRSTDDLMNAQKPKQIIQYYFVINKKPTTTATNHIDSSKKKKNKVLHHRPSDQRR